MSLNARRAYDALVSDDVAAESRDREWIARIRTGDERAFEAMFRCYGDRLCGFVYGYVQSTDEAQELVQDLFLWIWQHRHEWDVSGPLRTYLFQSMRNRAINQLRRRRVEQRFLERTLQTTPDALTGTLPATSDQRANANELATAIDEAVGRLPERCRQVFILNRQQRLSYAQIAEVLGISVKTVEIHMGRALSALRQRLSTWLR